MKKKLIPLYITIGIWTTELISKSQFNAVKVETSSKKKVSVGKDDKDGKDAFLVSRHTIDGELDIDFNATGFVTTPIGDLAVAQAVELQADAKIVAGGFSFTGATVGALVRYNNNGTLDATFGSNGIITTVHAGGVVINCISIQADGKIVASGSTITDGNSHIFLARYNVDGSLDSANFGINGIVTLQIGTNACGKSCKLMGTDIVIGASVDEDSFAIIKYDSSGTLDPNFGVGGIARTILGNPATPFSLAVQADGKLILAGSALDNITLVRYTSTGSLDGSFGTGGIVTTVRGRSSIARSVKVNLDGTIVIGGQSDKKVINAKYSANGVLDTSFGDQGFLTLNLGGTAQIRDMDLLSTTGPTGAIGIVNAGIVNQNGLLVELSATGALNCGFNNNGILTFFPIDSILRANFLFAATTSAQTLTTNFTDITFDINGPVVNWNHTPGSGTFICRESGTYLVVYSGIYAEAGLLSLANVSFIGLLNEVEITGSQLGINLSVGLGSTTVTRNFVVNVCKGDRLKLQHRRSSGLGTITLDLIGSGTTPIGGTVTIIKLT